jgi:hypothetical protein
VSVQHLVGMRHRDRSRRRGASIRMASIAISTSKRIAIPGAHAVESYRTGAGRGLECGAEAPHQHYQGGVNSDPLMSGASGMGRVAHAGKIPCTAGLMKSRSGAANVFYRWKKVYDSIPASEARELKPLREENAKLTRLVADLSLDKVILQDVVQKEF